MRRRCRRSTPCRHNGSSQTLRKTGAASVTEPATQLPEAERIAHAEAFYASLGITTVYGGDEAYYLPSADRVHMPEFGSFRDAAAHYSVLYHEGVHATAAKHRLDRGLSGRFGSEAYAMEEVIALS